MGLTKCVCGRHTDFGNLCVFCYRDKLLDKADESSHTEKDKQEPDEEVEENP